MPWSFSACLCLYSWFAFGCDAGTNCFLSISPTVVFRYINPSRYTTIFGSVNFAESTISRRRHEYFQRRPQLFSLGSECHYLIYLSDDPRETSFDCTNVIHKNRASESSWGQSTTKHYLQLQVCSVTTVPAGFFIPDTSGQLIEQFKYSRCPSWDQSPHTTKYKKTQEADQQD